MRNPQWKNGFVQEGDGPATGVQDGTLNSVITQPTLPHVLDRRAIRVADTHGVDDAQHIFSQAHESVAQMDELSSCAWERVLK